MEAVSAMELANCSWNCNSPEENGGKLYGGYGIITPGGIRVSALLPMRFSATCPVRSKKIYSMLIHHIQTDGYIFFNANEDIFLICL